MHPRLPLLRHAALLAGAALLAACADSPLAPTAGPAAPLRTLAGSSSDVCSVIDFSEFSHLSPVSSVSAAGVTFAVTGMPYVTDAGAPNPNVAPMAWNTDEPGNWEDGDLLVPRVGATNRCPACEGMGRILVVSDERNPAGGYFWGDSRWGGVMRFTAPAGSGTFYVEQYAALDQEPGSGVALALHLDNSATAVASASELGDASVETVVVSGKPTFTSSFEFRLGTPQADDVLNSGGIDNIKVCRVTPPPSNPGTGTPGYWKNHPAAWPTASITIGGRSYTRTDAIALMNAPTGGDKTYNLFEQLVSARLNAAIGNDASCISADLAAADAWMATYPVGSKVKASSAAWSSISATFTRLDRYNNGLLCAPHRD